MGTRKRSVEKTEGLVAEQAPQTSHDYLRQQLNADVEAYLASGGQIQELDSSMRGELADSDIEA